MCRTYGLPIVIYASANANPLKVERMKALGYRVLNAEPKRGADNKLIFFLHPKDTNGVLVELCQEILEG